MVGSGVARIPVVVHVVYRTDAENIADERVHRQIVVLNRDFGAGDDSFLPPHGPGSPRLQFVLAGTDPTGRPTTGITRTRTDVVAFADDDRVKRRATGGADAWPADRYLNIWVCRLGGGLLGYAQSPGGPAETDGVVVTHTGFGTTGTSTAAYDRGRTTTHEVGRYLNLFPAWSEEEPCSLAETSGVLMRPAAEPELVR